MDNWTLQTRYMLQRNTASIMKGFVWFYIAKCFNAYGILLHCI